ncbi:hypothetical protein C8P68_102730 [Mucilaginibacter yixingensis]|uniref:Uncharacterized protein n=1 Tax=Mucilaginibacter yixingensis TaxID=1295612 RepID=A0A2T5JDQ6_9SPHI|nr:hypothetical protein C8P68_102730 [Mucilaginibacter yixingensis]
MWPRILVLWQMTIYPFKKYNYAFTNQKAKARHLSAGFFYVNDINLLPASRWAMFFQILCKQRAQMLRGALSLRYAVGAVWV